MEYTCGLNLMQMNQTLKKGPGGPKKLNFRELGKGGLRLNRVGVTYKCTKCDKMGHNSRKYREKIQNLYALKRKVNFHFFYIVCIYCVMFN